MSADKGNISAMNDYGFYLTKGNGTPFNAKEGFRYLKMAADAGLTASMINVADSYRFRKGCPVNKAEAVRYLNLPLTKEKRMQ